MIFPSSRRRLPCVPKHGGGARAGGSDARGGGDAKGRVESGTGARGGRDRHSAGGAGQQGAPQLRAQEEAGHLRVEGDHRRCQPGHQECQGESSVRIPYWTY